LQAEGDDLSVSLETLQKQKVLHSALRVFIVDVYWGFSLVVWSDCLFAVMFKGSVGQTKQSTGGAAQWSQVSGEERDSAKGMRIAEITSRGFYLNTSVVYTTVASEAIISKGSQFYLYAYFEKKPEL